MSRLTKKKSRVTTAEIIIVVFVLVLFTFLIYMTIVGTDVNYAVYQNEINGNIQNQLAQVSVIDYIPEQIDPRTACVIITDGFGHGSGVHIGDGIILTAGHCVAIDNTWIIANNGRTYSIIDKWTDPFDEDIGFIKIRNKNIPKLEFGDTPEVGDTVHVIGTPLDLALSFNYTEGIVSRLYTDINGWWYDAMVVDAATYPGNSGGPVLNDNNEIVGILVGGYVGYDNMSICEPIENIRWSLESFLKYLEDK